MTAHILVVDDEPDVEMLIRQHFRKRIRDGSLAFSFAADGQAALEVIEATPQIDAVISDINMPRMDGLTLLDHLRALEEPKSTVIVSAYGDMNNIRSAMNRGAFDFLTKPLDLADLDATLAKTIAHVLAFREARDRMRAAERVQASLSRYFSPEVARRLAASGHESPAAEWREVAILFTDVAGFTGFVDSIEPGLLAEVLNDYLARMTDVIFSLNGTVAKFIGDAIEVLFNAPDDQEDYVTSAVTCAIRLDQAAEAFRQLWAERGVTFGVTRIGVHCGPALVGNFGGGRFFDYTAYGDTVNTTQRIEAFNKVTGTRVAVSEAVARRASPFFGRPIGDVTLRGRSAPVTLFEPMEEASHAAPQRESYARAFALMQAGDAAAMPAFAAHIGLYPADQLATLHLRRLLTGARDARLDGA
jgi:class 3 adenylate cyclase